MPARTPRALHSRAPLAGCWSLRAAMKRSARPFRRRRLGASVHFLVVRSGRATVRTPFAAGPARPTHRRLRRVGREPGSPRGTAKPFGAAHPYVDAAWLNFWEEMLGLVIASCCRTSGWLLDPRSGSRRFGGRLLSVESLTAVKSVKLGFPRYPQAGIAPSRSEALTFQRTTRGFSWSSSRGPALGSFGSGLRCVPT